MPQVKREYLQPWLKAHLDRGNMEGVCWVDREKGLFRLPWKHNGRQDWDETSGKIFKEWAINTNRYQPGDTVNYPKWKTNLRCALHKVKTIRQVAVDRDSYSDPHRIFQFVKLEDLEKEELAMKLKAEDIKPKVEGCITDNTVSSTQDQLHLPGQIKTEETHVPNDSRLKIRRGSDDQGVSSSSVSNRSHDISSPPRKRKLPKARRDGCLKDVNKSPLKLDVPVVAKSPHYSGTSKDSLTTPLTNSSILSLTDDSDDSVGFGVSLQEMYKSGGNSRPKTEICTAVQTTTSVTVNIPSTINCYNPSSPVTSSTTNVTQNMSAMSNIGLCGVPSATRVSHTTKESETSSPTQLTLNVPTFISNYSDSGDSSEERVNSKDLKLNINSQKPILNKNKSSKNSKVNKIKPLVLAVPIATDIIKSTGLESPSVCQKQIMKHLKERQVESGDAMPSPRYDDDSTDVYLSENIGCEVVISQVGANVEEQALLLPLNLLEDATCSETEDITDVICDAVNTGSANIQLSMHCTHPPDIDSHSTVNSLIIEAPFARCSDATLSPDSGKSVTIDIPTSAAHTHIESPSTPDSGKSIIIDLPGCTTLTSADSKNIDSNVTQMSRAPTIETVPTTASLTSPYTSAQLPIITHSSTHNTHNPTMETLSSTTVIRSSSDPIIPDSTLTLSINSANTDQTVMTPTSSVSDLPRTVSQTEDFDTMKSSSEEEWGNLFDLIREEMGEKFVTQSESLLTQSDAVASASTCLLTTADSVAGRSDSPMNQTDSAAIASTSLVNQADSMLAPSGSRMDQLESQETPSETPSETSSETPTTQIIESSTQLESQVGGLSHKGACFDLEILYKGECVATKRGVQGRCHVFPDQVSEAGQPEQKDDGPSDETFQLPGYACKNESPFTEKQGKKYTNISQHMVKGFTLESKQGQVYATRRCRTSLFYVSNTNPNPARIERLSPPQPVCISPTGPENRPSSDQTVYIVCGQKLKRDQLENALICVKIIVK